MRATETHSVSSRVALPSTRATATAGDPPGVAVSNASQRRSGETRGLDSRRVVDESSGRWLPSRVSRARNALSPAPNVSITSVRSSSHCRGRPPQSSRTRSHLSSGDAREQHRTLHRRTRHHRATRHPLPARRDHGKPAFGVRADHRV